MQLLHSPKLQIINRRRMDKESISVKDIHSQMKMQILNPCVYDVDSEKDKKSGHGLVIDFFPRSYKLSKRAERRALRGMEQTSKKLEKSFKIRDLHVGQETLHSTTSKDTFDMSCLNDSLPSASVNKKGFRRRLLQNSELYPWWKEQNFKRFGGIKFPMSSCTSQFGQPLDGLVRGSIKHSHFRQSARERRLHYMDHKETSADDTKEKANGEKYDSMMEKFLSVWENQDSSSCLVGQKVSLGSTVTDKLDDKELIEKTSDVQNWEFPPLLYPCCDAGKNWKTDLPSAGLSVPLNSPTKWKGDVSESRSAPSMVKLLSEVQHTILKVCREENKLRILNSHRGVFSEDIDRSEYESKSSQKIPSSGFKFDSTVRKSRKLRRALLDSAKEQLDLKLMMKLRTRVSPEYKRNIGSYLSLGNINSDKVLPD